METETLYQKIRIDFFRKVYTGEIKPDQQLPPERKQAEELSISRGTVRKARKILEDEGYITNTQGKGAVYTPLKDRAASTGEIIAVVVPVHNPFFMSYYRAFENAAEAEGRLVVIKQLDNGNADRLKEVLFSLFMKGIRDIVFWPYDTALDYRYIQRLSGLGMNVVFFDTVHDFSFCDFVSLDNQHAVSSLYDYLEKKGSRKIVYVGWDNPLLTSSTEREEAFKKIKSTSDRIIRLSWNQENLSEELLGESLDLNDLIEKNRTDGFLCGNGHIGLTLRNYLDNRGYSHIPLCTVDNFHETAARGITVYEQPFESMGKMTFHLLQNHWIRQDKMDESAAVVHYIKGRLIER